MNENKYRRGDKMSDLICDNHSLLMVMSRFGLSLGFGDKTVEAVCAAGGVDCDTFLAVAILQMSHWMHMERRQQQHWQEYCQQHHRSNMPSLR